MKVQEAGIWIDYMDVDEIQEAVRNPKDHDIGEIGMSIEEHGYVDPCILDERTGRLVKGHGRRQAVIMRKRAGRGAPEGIVVTNGKWFMPVLRGMEFRDEAEAEAYLVADNRLAELGGWDDPVLAQVLKEWGERGEEAFEGTGFDMDDAQKLVEAVFGKDGQDTEGEAEQEGEIGEEQGAEALEKWGVEDGDIWRVGEDLVVVCGDCRDVSSWRNGMGLFRGIGDYANGIVTSPPYARQREYGGRHGDRGVAEDEYVEWWKDVQARAGEYLAKDGSFFINIKPNTKDGERVLYVFDLVLAMKREWAWAFIDEFCWERIGNPGSWPNRFKNGFEPVYQFGLSPQIKFRPENVTGEAAGVFEFHGANVNTGGYFNTNDTRFEWEGALPSNRLEIKDSAKGMGHEAAFPWKLPAFFIKAFSDEGDIWVDPFLGSGSTLEACHRTGRRGFGIEEVPAYAALSIERLAVLTGQVPRKI